MIILSDELYGGGFQAIIGDENLMVRDTPFDHYGCSSPSEGAVSSVDVIVREYEVMAWLEVSFLEVDDIRVPIGDKTPEFFNSRSYTIGIPGDYRQIGPVSMAGIKC
ncbi:hypothetical protein TNCV_1713561 [Trichonephila clavipes]|nr:hypothetical protein TNCV_1713561 [Trichonephila clavipes]